MIYTGKFGRAEIYHNTKGETPEQIKSKTGCTTILNGILFNGDGSLCCDVRINGKWIANDQYTYYGLGWSGQDVPKRVHTNDAENYDNFLSCVPVQPDIRRGRAAIGFLGDTYTVLCVSDNSGAMTIPAAEKAMRERCEAYLILDGGGSSYLDCPGGKVDTTHQRKTANRTYILIWEKADSKNNLTEGKKMKICLDPGHGLKEAYNQSPDGTYFEHEFTLDMAKRIREYLTSCGVDVKLTREDSSTPSLTQRATTANTYGANLFVSLHSNAVSGGWNNSVNGLTVWTYAAGGERDRAAKLLLEEMKSAGVKTFGAELYHSKFTVLEKTNMPAYLVEYAFHTCHSDVALLKSGSHRDKLAKTTAKAICAWGGINWIEPSKEKEPASDIIYRVQVGAFATGANAEALKKELEAKGYKPFIVKEVNK